MGVSNYDRQTDRELAIGAANGDQRAFAALFDRYFAEVYDFAARTLRDTTAAADVAQRTFAEAWRVLGVRAVPEHVNGWLYGLARNTATGPQVTALEPGRMTTTPFIAIDPQRMPNAATVQQDVDLRELVWEAATEGGASEYSLLDMHLRRNLGAPEIAEGLSVGSANANAMLTESRDGLERTVTAKLLMRRGREGCPELNDLLTRSVSVDESSPELRSGVLAHAESCSTCQALRAASPSAAAVLAGFAFVAPPAGLQEITWANVVSPAVADVPLQPAGRKRRWWLIPLLAILGLLLVAVPIILLATSGSDDATVQDPDDVRSTSHEVDEESTDNVIEVVWSRQEGVLGYSVLWSEEPFEQPDEEADLSGDATEARSPALDPGDWYFHLRTQGEDGSWTSTVHLGPFPIEEEETPSPEPTETVTDTPEPEPTAPPVTAPPVTDTPAPTAPPTTPTPSP